MEFLPLLFAIAVRSALASDFQELYVPDYNIELSDNPQREYIGPSGAIDDDAKEAGNLKYNKLLFLLHNEKSNKAVLAHINKKDDNAATIKRTVPTGYRNADGDESESDSPKRQKRSAIKWLRIFFHGNGTTPPHKNEPPIITQLRQSKDINANATFTEILVNLTNTIKMLNKNLVGLKNEIKNNEGYVLIKMPMKKIEDKDDTQIQEFKRSKRDATEPNNTHVNVTLKEKRTKDTENLTKALTIARSIPNKKYDEVNKYDLEPNFTEPLRVDINVELNTSIPKNLTTDDKQTNLTIHNSKDEDISDLDKIKNYINYTTANITNTTTEVPHNNIITILRTNTSIEVNNKPSSQLSNMTDINGNDFLINTSRRMDFKGVVKKSVNDREELLLVIMKLYREIKDSILPVKDIKEIYSKQVMFQIGYIVANLDTLYFSLNKLMKKVALNKAVWETKRLLHVLRKLSLSKHLVANIMNFLYSYAEDHTI